MNILSNSRWSVSNLLSRPVLANTEKIVKSLLDVIILTLIHDEPQYGYKLIENIHLGFGVFLSPGTLYPCLDNLEEMGLILLEQVSRRKMYSLTGKGEKEVAFLYNYYSSYLEKMLAHLDSKLSLTLLTSAR